MSNAQPDPGTGSYGIFGTAEGSKIGTIRRVGKASNVRTKWLSEGTGADARDPHGWTDTGNWEDRWRDPYMRDIKADVSEIGEDLRPATDEELAAGLPSMVFSDSDELDMINAAQTRYALAEGAYETAEAAYEVAEDEYEEGKIQAQEDYETTMEQVQQEQKAHLEKIRKKGQETLRKRREEKQKALAEGKPPPLTKNKKEALTDEDIERISTKAIENYEKIRKDRKEVKKKKQAEETHKEQIKKTINRAMRKPDPDDIWSQALSGML